MTDVKGIKTINANANVTTVKATASKGFRFGGTVAREAFVA